MTPKANTLMNRFLLKAYLLLCSFAISLQTWAQADDDDLSPSRGGRSLGDDLEDMGGMMDYHPVRFGIGDVITVVLLIVACYVFGKIWKGCSYLILIVAAVFYYLLRG